MVERKRDMDERVALPLDPETALQALLEVDLDDEPDELDVREPDR